MAQLANNLSALDQLRKAAPSAKPVSAPLAKPPKAVDPIAPKKPTFKNTSVTSGTLKQSSLLASLGLGSAVFGLPWIGTIVGRGAGAELMERYVPRVLTSVDSVPGLGSVSRGLNTLLDTELSDPEDWIVHRLFPKSSPAPPIRPVRQLLGDSVGGLIGGGAGGAAVVGLADAAQRNGYIREEEQ